MERTKKQFLIVIDLLFLIPIAQAPDANPYDFYNVDTYNCLHIAQDCQRWHEINNINTTIVIGMFNETHGHAWLINADTGEDIIGYTAKWEYTEIIYEGTKRYEYIIC